MCIVLHGFVQREVVSDDCADEFFGVAIDAGIVCLVTDSTSIRRLGM